MQRPHSTCHLRRTRFLRGRKLNGDGKSSRIRSIRIPINKATRKTRLDLLAHHCRGLYLLDFFGVDVAMDFTAHKHEVRSWARYQRCSRYRISRELAAILGTVLALHSRCKVCSSTSRVRCISSEFKSITFSRHNDPLCK